MWKDYTACLKCSSKIEIDPEDNEIGECTKCQMLQSIHNCKKSLSAQITVKTSDGTIMSFRAFDHVICDIIQVDHSFADITAKMLLKATSFSMSHINGIIKSIHHN